MRMKKKSEAFNTCFSSMFGTKPGGAVSSSNSNETLPVPTVMKWDVEKQLLKLDLLKSSVLDHLHPGV